MLHSSHTLHLFAYASFGIYPHFALIFLCLLGLWVRVMCEDSPEVKFFLPWVPEKMPKRCYTQDALFIYSLTALLVSFFFLGILVYIPFLLYCSKIYTYSLKYSFQSSPRYLHYVQYLWIESEWMIFRIVIFRLICA